MVAVVVVVVLEVDAISGSPSKDKAGMVGGNTTAERKIQYLVECH